MTTMTAKPRRLLPRIAWLPFLTMAGLAVMGVFAIYSASYRGEDQPTDPFYRMQMAWVAVGLCAFLVAAIVDYRQIGKWTWVLYSICVMLLVVVLIFGVERYGSRSWLGIKGLGIQPSEFAKIGLAFALADYLSNPDRDVRSFKSVLVCLAMVGGTAMLILMQPDLGSTLVLVPMSAVMMFVAGIRLRYFVTAIAAIAIAGAVFYMNLRGYEAAAEQVHAVAKDRTAYVQQLDKMGRKFILKPYQWERVLVFLNPERDPYGWGWNLRQSLIAVGSGGFWGKGWLQGTQNVLGFLPRQVAPNDFIFSVIAEEGGFVWCLAVLVGFTVLLLSGIWTALTACDRLGRLLATGITVMLFCHIFVNMGMTVGLVPITGLPLPLLSYGGSFVVSTMVALGILQSIQARRRAH
ncbi:MAG: rod shape-determining protein RodA [Verrucomicrobia bacterium]|nr:rod shape-determining protein RodA [Verrucomicrobiota bacterium]